MGELSGVLFGRGSVLRCAWARMLFASGKPMSATLTPMMQQYQGIRRTLTPDTILLFRLGDFYEMFFEDAKRASAVLNLALTKRNEVPIEKVFNKSLLNKFLWSMDVEPEFRF